MLISLFTMVTRKKALMQVIALVSMDNGLYLAGIIATLGLPLFVEIALFFDLLVGVIIMGVFAFRINQTFETVNTDRLRQLRG
jgi:hydrogenase-4 component E